MRGELPVVSACDIADGVDLVALGEDRDVGREPLAVRDHTDSHEHLVKFNPRAVIEDQRLQPVTGSDQVSNAGAQTDLNSFFALQVNEPLRHLWVERARQGQRLGFDQRHIGAVAHRGGGDFLTDQAGTENDKALTGLERTAQPFGVVEGPESVDVGVLLGAGQRPRSAARRDH
uniref:Unannotated protein n=1 Tax=freshwater metagenome TaxID=449393 RepID=A0A6J5ZVP7_9ZZZZ